MGMREPKKRKSRDLGFGLGGEMMGCVERALHCDSEEPHSRLLCVTLDTASNILRSLTSGVRIGPCLP